MKLMYIMSISDKTDGADLSLSGIVGIGVSLLGAVEIVVMSNDVS